MGEFLTPEGVVAGMRATSKKQVLQELAKLAAKLTGESDRTILDVLLERERLGSTGVGRGIAIPHGKLGSIPAVCGLFARLQAPIDFDAIDDEPVDLVFLLLAPEGAGAEHLKALARVSRALRNDTLCEKLRGCDNPEAIYVILNDEQALNAA